MRRSVVMLALLALACADPAKDKPKAKTGEAIAAKPETPAGTPDPAKGGAPTPAAPKAETLAIAAKDSSIGFVGSKVTGSHTGSFSGFTGNIELVEGAPEKSKVSFEIDMATVSTDAEGLTKHLLDKDFFEVATYPKAKFESVEIKAGGENGATHTVTGNLDFHGVKKAITFPATISVTPEAVTATSEFALNRMDFNVVYKGKADDLIRPEVVIKLALKAPRTK
jgi:polyisoprenoid-binding protein YceI